MVIEHTFITTLSSQAAFGAASEMLAVAGFGADTQEGFPLGDTQWTTLQMKRGKKDAARAKDPTECPQRIRVDYDRGRITVAATIELPPNILRLTTSHAGASAAAKRGTEIIHAKVTEDYSHLMLKIVNSLENLLSAQGPVSVANREWLELESGLKLKGKKMRRVGLIIGAVFIVLVFALVLFIVSHSKD